MKNDCHCLVTSECHDIERNTKLELASNRHITTAASLLSMKEASKTSKLRQSTLVDEEFCKEKHFPSEASGYQIALSKDPIMIRKDTLGLASG